MQATRGPTNERARQSREIVYYLNPPESHSFALTHDYTEKRAGTRSYVNIVRPGSVVTNPSAVNLDTGEALPWEKVRGQAILTWEPEAEGITPESEAIVFHFPPVKAGESLRLRIAETYTDPVGYGLSGETLTWRRTLGRPANAVVLPAGWVLSESVIPATVSETEDGRARLEFLNPRPDELDVSITATRGEWRFVALKGLT